MASSEALRAAEMIVAAIENGLGTFQHPTTRPTLLASIEQLIDRAFADLRAERDALRAALEKISHIGESDQLTADGAHFTSVIAARTIARAALKDAGRD